MLFVAKHCQAMNLKGINYRETPINLVAGEQNSEKFRKVNPLGSVPAVMIEGQDGKEPLTVRDTSEDNAAF